MLFKDPYLVLSVQWQQCLKSYTWGYLVISHLMMRHCFIGECRSLKPSMHDTSLKSTLKLEIFCSVHVINDKENGRPCTHVIIVLRSFTMPYIPQLVNFNLNTTVYCHVQRIDTVNPLSRHPQWGLPNDILVVSPPL